MLAGHRVPHAGHTEVSVMLSGGQAAILHVLQIWPWAGGLPR